MAARPVFEKHASSSDTRMVSAVPPSARTDAAWSDRVIEGCYGRVAVRETRGRGLPIVLIHGEESTKDVFRLQMSDALGARYRMVAVDLPGHGASEALSDPDGNALTLLADAVIDTLERLGLERFALLGWSLGGYVALEIAASAPGAMGVMVVGTPALELDREAIRSHSGASPQGAETTGPERGDQDRADALTAAVAAMTADRHALASSLGLPLAIVNGAGDPAVQQASIGPASAMWEGRPHVFPLAGRAPFLDAPEVFNATLARFIHSLETEAGTAGPGLCLAG